MEWCLVKRYLARRNLDLFCEKICHDQFSEMNILLGDETQMVHVYVDACWNGTFVFHISVNIIAK